MRPMGLRRTDTRAEAEVSTRIPYLRPAAPTPAGVSTQSWSTTQSATVFGLALRSSASRARSTASNARRARPGSNDGDSASSAAADRRLHRPRVRAGCEHAQITQQRGHRVQMLGQGVAFAGAGALALSDDRRSRVEPTPDVARVGDQFERPLRARAKTAEPLGVASAAARLPRTTAAMSRAFASGTLRRHQPRRRRRAATAARNGRRASRSHRRQQRARLRGHEHEHGARRRFLERLEQGVLPCRVIDVSARRRSRRSTPASNGLKPVS